MCGPQRCLNRPFIFHGRAGHARPLQVRHLYNNILKYASVIGKGLPKKAAMP